MIASIHAGLVRLLPWILITAFPIVSVAATQNVPRSEAGQIGYKIGYMMAMSCPFIGIGLIVIGGIFAIRRDRKFKRDNDERRYGRSRW